MRKPRIDIIAGARPNFMKVASVIRAINLLRPSFDYRLVHTGQHYDAKMSDDFFTQLGIPAPNVNLGVGSGSQAEQAGTIMIRYEKLLSQDSSDMCLVVGDVTSTLACAITARKCGLDVAHVEGGIRSGDWTMPEEINRVVTDSITNYFFTTSETANENLRTAGIGDDRIYFVGNTMIDTLLTHLPALRPPAFWDTMRLTPQNYLLLTLHRPNNVDSKEILGNILYRLAEAARDLSVIFPVHPRTAKVLQEIGRLPPTIRVVEPQPYLEFNWLARAAKAVLTDSGGVTEETTVLGVPCLTLRESTERPETVTIGTNELIGTDPRAIAPALARLFNGKWKSGGVPDKWDGQAGIRIVRILETLLANSPRE